MLSKHAEIIEIQNFWKIITCTTKHQTPKFNDKNVFTERLQYYIIYAVIIREKYINFGFEFINYN